MDSPHLVSFGAIAWQSAMAGMRFKEHVRGGRRLRLVEYTPEMAPHWCERGHLGYVLDGRLEISFSDEVVVLETGDGVDIPSGPEHRHMGRALTEVVRVIFVEDV